MKMLLLLAFVASTRAALIHPNLPFQSYYRGPPSFGLRSTPCGSSTPLPLEINSGFVSTTPTPLEINGGFLTSTSSPLGINSGLLSSGSLQENEYGQIFSSTPRPDVGINENIFSSTLGPDVDVNQGIYSSSSPSGQFLNQGLNSLNLQNYEGGQFGLSPLLSGNGQLINIETNSLSNSFSQKIPSRLGDYNSISIQSTTSGGSINDAFGISEESFESQSERPEVSKNVYFFAAPEEPEPIRPKIYFEQSKKNVNLIFIKAPAPPVLGPIEITPPQQQSPEKTVVYVLVKKPEQQQDIVVKSGPVNKPRKPEVFFIKYKNEEEAQHTISQVQTANVNAEDHQSADELNHSQELFNVDSAKYSIKTKPTLEYISEQPGSLSGLQSGLSSTETSFTSIGNGVTQSPELVQLPFNSASGLNFNPGLNINSGTTFTSIGNGVTQSPELVRLPLNSASGLNFNPGLNINSGTTFSSLGNGVTQSPALLHLPLNSGSGLNFNPGLNINSGINNVPLIYSTPRPQVSINEISGDALNNQFISIGGRPTSSELLHSGVTSTYSPLIVSSTASPVTPCGSSSQIPFTYSSTVRPDIPALNPFLKKK